MYSAAGWCSRAHDLHRGPVFRIPGAGSYAILLGLGFWLGVAGSSFAVGIPFVSRWFPPEKQGVALGIYGLGNIGLSAAVFFGPTVAKRFRMGERVPGRGRIARPRDADFCALRPERARQGEARVACVDGRAVGTRADCRGYSPGFIF